MRRQTDSSKEILYSAKRLFAKSLMYITFCLGLGLSVIDVTAAIPQAITESKFVSGVVIDKKLGETIPGVAVAIWQEGRLVKGASTDIDGTLISPNP